MLKRNYVLLGILSFLVIGVIGYALFSQSLSITGSSKAQGNFEIVGYCGFSHEIKALCDQAGADEGYTKEELEECYGTTDSKLFGDGSGYSNYECNVSGTTVTHSVSLNMPGAHKYFITEFKNIGTIPAETELYRTALTYNNKPFAHILLPKRFNLCYTDRINNVSDCYNSSQFGRTLEANEPGAAAWLSNAISFDSSMYYVDFDDASTFNDISDAPAGVYTQGNEVYTGIYKDTVYLKPNSALIFITDAKMPDTDQNRFDFTNTYQYYFDFTQATD